MCLHMDVRMYMHKGPTVCRSRRSAGENAAQVRTGICASDARRNNVVRRRLAAAIGTGAALALALGACSGTPAETQGTPSGSPATSQTGGSDDGLAGEIEVRVYADWEFVQTYADQFMAANPDVKINVTGLDSDWLREQAGRVFLSSESPDVISWTLSAELYDAWAAAGALLEMQDVWDAAGLTGNVPDSAVANSQTSDGGLFAAPLGLTITPLMYLNTQKLPAEVAATISETHEFASIDEFHSVMDHLLAQGDEPAISTSGQIADIFFSWTLLNTCGADVYNAMSLNWKPGGESAPKYTDACGVEAIRILQEWVEKGYFPQGLPAINQEQSQALFETERSGAWLQGSWSAASAKPPFDWTWTTLPSLEAGRTEAFMGGLDSFLIPSGTEAPDVAKAFVAYMLSKETLEGGMGRVPIRTDLDLEKVIPDAPLSREIANAVAGRDQIAGWSHLVPVPVLNAYSQTVVEGVMLGQGSAEDAAATIQRAADQFRADNG